MQFSRFSLLKSIKTSLNSWLQQAPPASSESCSYARLFLQMPPTRGAHFKNASLARFNHGSRIVQLKGDVMAV